MVNPAGSDDDEAGSRRKRSRTFDDSMSDETPKRPEPVKRVTRLSLSSPPKTEAVGPSKKMAGHPRDREGEGSDFRRQLDIVSSPHQEPTTLHKRLFAEGQIPSGGRLNSYSKPEYLVTLRKVMYGSQELEYLKDSVFGSLFRLQIRKAVLSGKLVHQFICRTLVTRKKHEVWFLFGGKPIRFSLQEFAYLTGLKCGPYPSDDTLRAVKKAAAGKAPFWNRLIGDREHCTVADIVDMLVKDKELSPENRMSAGRRVRLALLVLVEGVLIPSSSTGRVSKEVVEMVKDLDFFLEYPWGRLSFELTLEMVLCGNQNNPTVESLRDKLSNSHLTMKGFTLAYQLLIFSAVPMLIRILPPEKKWFCDFLDDSIKIMPKFNRFHNDNILLVERSAELKVISILHSGSTLGEGDLSWEDEVEDPQVDELVCRVTTEHDRETVLGLAKPKQRTIRRMLGIKRKEDSDTQCRKTTTVVDGSCSGSKKTKKTKFIESNLDSLFAAKRDKFIASIDILLAELKSEISAGKCGQQQHQDNSLKIGSQVEVKRSKGKNVEQVLSSESRSSEGHAEDNRCPSSEGTAVDQTKQMSKLDDVVDIIHGVINDLECAKDTVGEDHEQAEKLGTSNVVTNEENVNMNEANPDGQESCPDNDAFPVEEEDFLMPNECTDIIPLPEGNVANTEVHAYTLVHDGDVQTCEDNNSGRCFNIDDDGNSNESVDGDDGQDSGSKKEDGGLDDEFPLRSKRERKLPTKYRQEGMAETKQSVSKEASLSSISSGGMDDSTKKQFLSRLRAYRQREYIINGHPQPRTFFKTIYRPTNHVDTEHMEAMLYCVWRRLSSNLMDRRVAVLDSWFTQLLIADHGRYVKGRRDTKSFNWNSTLRKYVLGEVHNRAGKLSWLVDVDMVYAPMNMGKDHWVAICIDLKEGVISVYDSNIDKNSDAKVTKLMKPIADILPAVLGELGLVDQSVYIPADKFVIDRPTSVSQNSRGGDCGPMTVKFIELRGQGLSVGGFSNEFVDNLRMMYAIEVYNEFVEQLA